MISVLVDEFSLNILYGADEEVACNLIIHNHVYCVFLQTNAPYMAEEKRSPRISVSSDTIEIPNHVLQQRLVFTDPVAFRYDCQPGSVLIAKLSGTADTQVP